VKPNPLLTYISALLSFQKHVPEVSSDNVERGCEDAEEVVRAPEVGYNQIYRPTRK
jgi:hypothetical protein